MTTAADLRPGAFGTAAMRKERTVAGGVAKCDRSTHYCPSRSAQWTGGKREKAVFAWRRRWPGATVPDTSSEGVSSTRSGAFDSVPRGTRRWLPTR